LSRSDPKLVENILAVDVPEIADKIVTIKKVVREAGYRTKIAVISDKSDVDPVGACVGLKGTRIQNVIRELSGEKIDVLRYDEDPHVFIKNALSPAEVKKVVVLDEDKKLALAVVSESEFSIAIGKQGQNVRLANRLCDWNIDVKTEEQAAEMDVSETDARKAAENLFNGDSENYEEITSVAQLSGIEPRVVELLKNAELDDIERFVAAAKDGSALKVEGLTQEDIDAVSKVINDTVEFEEEDAADAAAEDAQPQEVSDDEEEEYFCPECGAKISLDMSHCPKCGVELVFEEE